MDALCEMLKCSRKCSAKPYYNNIFEVKDFTSMITDGVYC